VIIEAVRLNLEITMPNRHADPSMLEGEALQRWYVRTPQEIEAEKRKAEAERHARFVASIQQQDPGPRRRSESPLDVVSDAFDDFQSGPKIQRPSLAESFMPVIGPAWEAVADLQDGNYGGAAFNGAMAVADLLPIGVAAKGIKAATKGVGLVKKGSRTANAAAQSLRAKGVAGAGQEIHHSVPLNGTSRKVQDWRNHYPFLKVLPVEQHRRLTGRWGTLARYDPIQRIWYGTTDWQKAVPAGVAGYVADTVENLVGGSPSRPSASQPPPTPQRQPQPPAVKKVAR
jgi:hypothetical protein